MRAFFDIEIGCGGRKNLLFENCQTSVQQHEGRILRMKTMTLICSECGKKYTLGKDAVAVTREGLFQDFRGVTIITSDSRVDPRTTPTRPDLVDSIPPDTNESDRAKILKRAHGNTKIIFANYPFRRWKCRKCQKVQDYSSSIVSTE